jgi:pimeloyl-ACP methyl ester carboxylesterase
MEEHAQAVARILESLGARSTHLVGHSMGGAIALLLAGLLQEPPLSQISLEGNLVGDDCRFGSRAIVSQQFAEFLDRGFEQLLSPATAEASPGEALYPSWLEKSDALALHRSAASLVEWSDSTQLLTRFLSGTERKIYFYGERNRDAEVLGLLPSIEKIAVPRAGHFVMNDQPKAFYGHLSTFLRISPP